MRAYSLRKAKEMVRIYNETKNIHKVSDALQMPLNDAKQIMRWLHLHDPKNKPKKDDQGKSFSLAVPDCHIWARFLYTQDIPAHTAAACCNWPLQRLLESCYGPKEWAKTHNRAPLKLHVNDINCSREEQNRRDEDPSLEEIQKAAEAVRAGWHPNDARRPERQEEPRVEVTSYRYDTRTGTFM